MGTKDNAVAEALPGTNLDLIKSDQLNALSSYADVLELLGITGTEEGLTQLEWDTNPFQLVDKSQLLNTQLVLIQWRFVAGDFGEFVYVSALARLDNGTDWAVAFVDGSTGVYAQLRDLTASRVQSGHAHPQQGALVKGGLTASNYTYTDEKGQEKPATTYYLTNNRKVRA